MKLLKLDYLFQLLLGHIKNLLFIEVKINAWIPFLSDVNELLNPVC